jgi:putative sterol carrier protein
LSCEFNALTAEATSLFQNYQRIVGTDYANVSEIGGMCRIQANALSDDLVKTQEFAERFQAFKAEYQARSSCAARVEQSLWQVTLTDLPHAPDLLKSIIDSFEGEIRAASALEAQITKFAKQMISSQKAITTIQKVHRAVCTADLPAGNEHASR